MGLFKSSTAEQINNHTQCVGECMWVSGCAEAKEKEKVQKKWPYSEVKQKRTEVMVNKSNNWKHTELIALIDLLNLN